MNSPCLEKLRFSFSIFVYSITVEGDGVYGPTITVDYKIKEI